jgi:serpin B
MLKYLCLALSTTFALLLNLLPPFVVTASSVITEIQDNGQFCMNLLQNIDPSYEQNAGVAPHGITTILTLLLAGSEGNTYDEILKAGCFKKNDYDVIREKLSSLNTQIQNNSKKSDQKLTMVNGLYICKEQSNKIKDDYKEILERDYDGEIFKSKLSCFPEKLFESKQDDEVEDINLWVKDKTNGKIPSIIQTVPKAFVCMLLNAFYAKCLWSSPFDKNDTKEDIFYGLDDTQIRIPFMRAFDVKLKLIGSTDYSAVSIPFKDDLSMIVVLPEKGKSLQSLEKILEKETLGVLFEKLEDKIPEKIQLKLPKWTQECEYDLSSVMKNMGMKSAFELHSAEFSKMCTSDEFAINKISHTTYMNVNEEGAEVAAATGVVFSDGPMNIKKFIADRPFSFFIVDNQNKCIHLAGRVVKPQCDT